MLAAAVTLDTEEIFGIPNEDLVIVTDISNVLNVTSDDTIDGLTNGAITNYKRRNFIPILPLLVRSVEDMIASSRGDA